MVSHSHLRRLLGDSIGAAGPRMRAKRHPREDADGPGLLAHLIRILLGKGIWNGEM